MSQYVTLELPNVEHDFSKFQKLKKSQKWFCSITKSRNPGQPISLFDSPITNFQQHRLTLICLRGIHRTGMEYDSVRISFTTRAKVFTEYFINCLKDLTRLIGIYYARLLNLINCSIQKKTNWLIATNSINFWIQGLQVQSNQPEKSCLIFNMLLSGRLRFRI